jgi:adenylate cyclase
VPDETYTRRICAILLGDVSGYSALVGEDDERTARAIEQLQSVVRAIVTEANGYAEARAGDAIFASFDSVVAAVQAALTIHRRVAEEEFAGHRLQVRIGIHFGDVLVRDGASVGEGVGDAINIAARLQALARPGTVCISEAVYLQVRKKFDEMFIDLGNQQLKNISYPVHAYLTVPREAAGEHGGPPRRSALRWRVFAGVAVVLLAGATALVLQHLQVPGAKRASGPRSPSEVQVGQAEPTPAGAVAEGSEKQGQVALGVMLFKGLGGDAGDDWRREALRDGLNTQLSQLSRVKVYSKEFIDFLVSRKGLTEIEAATQLGISKMLSGSFVVVNGTMRIEMHVVDVKTGVLESSYTTIGREADFLNLQSQLAFSVISHLDLPVTAEEKQLLLARRTTDEDALKMLLEAEGGAAPPPTGKPVPERKSALPQWLARPRLLGAAPARADDQAAQTAILEAIERYRRATEARDLRALAALYADFPPEQQAAQQRYFDNVRDLKISIDNPDIAVVGDEAVVSFTRTDDFVDARTGRPMHVAVRLTKILRQQNGDWKMAGK